MSKLTVGKLNKSSKKVAVIMAGGSGTRFWPLSRRSFPKQFLPFGDDEKSLIYDTYKRVQSIVDDVLVVTAAHQVDLVKEHLPGVCILAEPSPRNTAACVAYASKYIESEVGDASTLFLPADHKISGEKEIQNTFSKALEVAEQNPVLVTIGIVPRKPETAYGYIKKGKSYNSDSFFVENFYEKPNLEKAKEYYESGEFFWNSGVFAWKVSSINSKLEQFLPEVFNTIKDFDFNDQEHIEKTFQSIPSESIDTGVMEKTDNAVVIPGDNFKWSDIGSWDAWMENMIGDENNLLRGDVLCLDSKGCGVVTKEVLANGKTSKKGISDKLVAIIGLEDVVVVDTEDALLVCKKQSSQDVKKVVQMLKDKSRESLI